MTSWSGAGAGAAKKNMTGGSLVTGTGAGACGKSAMASRATSFEASCSLGRAWFQPSQVFSAAWPDLPSDAPYPKSEDVHLVYEIVSLS